MTMKIDELKPKIGFAAIDMDGVLCWLDKFVIEFNDLSLPFETNLYDDGYSEKYWKETLKNADVYKLFANLEWQPNGKNLISWFQQRKYPIKFLTRPTAPPTTEDCIAGKKEWLKRQGLSNIPVIFERNKERYATNPDGTVNILIDDHSGNVQKFIDAGGLSIHYRDFWFPEVKIKLERIYGDQDETE